MTKRVRFSEEVDSTEPQEKISKHTLDSDEEDNTEEDKAGVLKSDEIEGQEEKTVDFDDDIRITPFNMEDEMEEGHFDASGTFIFNKQKEIRDNWLDNIDWMSVPSDQRNQNDNEDDGDNDSLGDDDMGHPRATTSDSEIIDLYKQIVDHLEPGETVLKAMRRLGKLGGSKSQSASERWKKRKSLPSDAAQEKSVDDIEKHRNTMNRLTELADKLLQSGEYDIYEETLERINYRIKSYQNKSDEKHSVSLDMFSEENNDTTSNNRTTTSNDVVLWELKRLKSESAPVEGPYSTEQLIEWKEKGDFATEEVYVRRAGTDSEFYSSRRIDFELYA